MPENSGKPLVAKAYGSIPHLPNSRLGEGDRFISFGQADILTHKSRDRFDRIIVQEKLDGSCSVVANVDGQLIALGRAGWPADTAPYEHYRRFAKWVQKNITRFEALNLKPGERVAGEWLAMAHGTIYDLSGREPYVCFDILNGKDRIPFDEFCARIDQAGLVRAPLLHDGSPLHIDEALKLLGSGKYGSTEPPEGVVYRCERRGKFDYLAKFVRQDKVDGKYFPKEGQEIIWLCPD